MYATSGSGPLRMSVDVTGQDLRDLAVATFNSIGSPSSTSRFNLPERHAAPLDLVANDDGTPSDEISV